MFSNYPDVVTVEQLCEMLGVGKNTAYSLIKRDEIHHVRIGRQIKIPKSAVIELLDKRK